MTALEQLGALAGVTVKIEAELDRIDMPLADVVALDYRSLIGTSRAPGDPVRLYAGGAWIASGELIAIEKRLWLRITSLAPAGRQ